MLSFHHHVIRNMVADGGWRHGHIKLVQGADSLHGIKKILGHKSRRLARPQYNSCANHHESSKTIRSLAPRK